MGRDLVLGADLGDHVEGHRDDGGEDQQAQLGAPPGLGATWPSRQAVGVRPGPSTRAAQAVWATAESVVAGSRIRVDRHGRRVTPLQPQCSRQCSPSADGEHLDPRGDDHERRTARARPCVGPVSPVGPGRPRQVPGGSVGEDRRMPPARPRPSPPSGYQRFTNRELSRLDFGARLLDLSEDAARAAARAGQVHGHLLGAPRRVLPGAGGRARGPGGGRRSDPLRRRPAPGRAAARSSGPGSRSWSPARTASSSSASSRPWPRPACGCRTGRPSTTTTGRTWWTSSTGRSSRCSPRWPSTRGTRSPTSRTCRSTWWSRWATR